MLLIALLRAGPSSAGTRVGGINFPGAPRAGVSTPSSPRTHWGNTVRWLGLAPVPGQYHDRETDLFENWNRFYDPSIGRYLGPDPLAYEPGYLLKKAGAGQSVPVYAYAGNNPIGNIDPDGRQDGPAVERRSQAMADMTRACTGGSEADCQAVAAVAAVSAVPIAVVGGVLAVNAVAASPTVQLALATVGVGLAPKAQTLQEQMARAVQAGGSATTVFTNLTQSPQAGRALSVATGEGAQALAAAARQSGMLFRADIPNAMIRTLESNQLVIRSTTQMGDAIATELQFLPEATPFIVHLFEQVPK